MAAERAGSGYVGSYGRGADDVTLPPSLPSLRECVAALAPGSAAARETPEVSLSTALAAAGIARVAARRKRVTSRPLWPDELDQGPRPRASAPGHGEEAAPAPSTPPTPPAEEGYDVAVSEARARRPNAGKRARPHEDGQPRLAAAEGRRVVLAARRKSALAAELNLPWDAVVPDWRTRRNSWRKAVRTAGTVDQVAALMLELDRARLCNNGDAAEPEHCEAPRPPKKRRRPVARSLRPDFDAVADDVNGEDGGGGDDDDDCSAGSTESGDPLATFSPAVGVDPPSEGLALPPPTILAGVGAAATLDDVLAELDEDTDDPPRALHRFGASYDDLASLRGEPVEDDQDATDVSDLEE